MIVLSRKKNESIVIDNNITVTVVEIRGDKVRLGIVSPKEVPVHRQEVYDAIHGRGPEPTPYVISAVPSPAVESPVYLSDRYTVDHQYVLRFERKDDHAQRVVDFLASIGLCAETAGDGRCRAVLTEEQLRRFQERFRVRMA